jgi:trigger factor
MRVSVRLFAGLRERAGADRIEVELPETLIEEETDHRVDGARERAERAGMQLDDLLAAQGWDEARLRADAREHAIRAIESDLVLESVARGEGLEVTAEELGAEIGRLAATLGRDPKDVAKTLERTGQIVALAGDIIRSKALDLLVERADVTSEGGRSAPNEDSSEGAPPPDQTDQTVDRAEGDS